jgi:5-(carboxyamino)imidazole ribonucleotide mutase
MVQMPAGIPVATVAIDGGSNAGLLALEMLAISNSELSAKLDAYRTKMQEKVLKSSV